MAKELKVSTKGICSTSEVAAIEHPGERALYGVHYRDAVKRGRVPMSVDGYRRVIRQNCYYCDTPPSNPTKFNVGFGVKPFLYNGADRVNSARGYELDNVVACCKLCNKMKSNRPGRAFVEHCRLVAGAQVARLFAGL